MKRAAILAMTILLIASAFAGALSLAACGGVPDDAVAKVGDETVSKDQYQQLMKQTKTQTEAQGYTFPSKGSDAYNSYSAQIVTYLVQTELVNQGATDLGIKVTADEVTEQVDSIASAYGGEDKLKSLLEYQGMTMSLLRISLRNQLVTQKASAAVTKGTKVSADDVQAYWDSHSGVFQKQAKRTVRHILVETKARALKVREALLAGDSWKAVAKKYSTDTATKKKGGALGAIKRGEMVKAFETAVFSLSEGTISQPVKTKYGWHILQVTQVTEAEKVDFADVKAKVQKKALNQAKQKKWSAWLDKLEAEIGVVYADGFDPDALTASASPSPSASATSGD